MLAESRARERAPAGRLGAALVARQAGQDRGTDALDLCGVEARALEGVGKQPDARLLVARQHAQRALYRVRPGREAQRDRSVFERCGKSLLVARTRPLHEEIGRHRGTPFLARRVERGTAAPRELDRQQRQRGVADQPGLDAAGTGHPFDALALRVRRNRERREKQGGEDAQIHFSSPAWAAGST